MMRISITDHVCACPHVFTYTRYTYLYVDVPLYLKHTQLKK